LLLKHVSSLREKGKALELRKNSVMKARGLHGWKTQRKMAEDLTVFEARCLIAEQQFIIL
jgi:hypothetical protein